MPRPSYSMREPWNRSVCNLGEFGRRRTLTACPERVVFEEGSGRG